MVRRDEMMRRQRTLADFGDFVLDHEDLDEILNEGCRLIAEALDTDLAKAIEIERERDTGFIRAGVGWRPGIVGHERISLSERSSEAYAIERAEPVITNDLAREDRFEFPPFLGDHGVVALVNVPIFLPGRRPWGILQVDAREAREFDQEDIEFLKTYAMAVGPVIDRLRIAHGRDRAEEAARECENRYRTLFETMDEAYALVEVLRDDAGRWSDFRFIEVNPAFIEHTSMPWPVGKTATELLGTPNPHWAELYGTALDTGAPLRVEEDEASLGRTFDLNIFVVDREQSRVAVLFTDITERKKAEAALRESEARQAFMLKLADTLRPLADPVQIQSEAARVLGEHLRASRAAYAEIDPDEAHFTVHHDYTHGVPTFAGRHPLAQYGTGEMWDVLRAGRTILVLDAERDPRLTEKERTDYAAASVRAAIGVPLVKDGRLRVAFFLHFSSAQELSPQEVRLVEETAERVWAAVARARAEASLRESEGRQAFLLALGDAMRGQSSARATIEVVGRLLAERLNPSRVIFAEFHEADGTFEVFHAWLADGAEPFPTVVPQEDFNGPHLDGLHAGRTLRVDDAGNPPFARPDLAALAAVGIKAALSVPLILGGRLMATLSLHQHEARRWTDDEVSLVQEVAERLWADVVRVRAEAALRKSEEKFRTLFETMAQGYAEIELVRDDTGRAIDHRLLELNPAFERLLGVPVAQARGRTIRELFPEVLEDTWNEAHDRVVRTRTPERTEQRFGPLGRWYEVFSYPTHGDRLVVLYDDITERKQAEVALADEFRSTKVLQDLGARLVTEENIQTIYEAVLTAAIEITQAKAGTVQMLDTESDELVTLATRGFSQRTMDYFHRVDASSNTSCGLALRTGGRSYFNFDPNSSDHAVRLHVEDGVLSAQSSPLVSRSGRPIGMVSTHWSEPDHRPSERELGFLDLLARQAADLMEQRQVQAGLRETEARFRQFGEASSDLLWIRNAETLAFEYLSPAFEKLYGAPREQVLKRNDVKAWLELIHPDDRHIAADALRKLVGGIPSMHEFRAVHPDGAVRWISNTDFPMLDERGQVQRIAGIAADVTEEKRAVELQGTLLAELQHRVRNVLALVRSIISRTEDRDGDLDSFRAHLMGRIDALARTQALLTRHVGAGVNLENLIRDEMLAQSADGARFTLQGPAVVLAPKAAEVLTLAVHELATNANKYGALAAPRGRIEVTWDRVRPDGVEWIELTWQEHGAGVVARSPSTRGFGAELVTRRVPYELKGQGEWELRPAGAFARIAFPLTPGESILQTDSPGRAGGDGK